jgi:hypothetical protein
VSDFKWTIVLRSAVGELHHRDALQFVHKPGVSALRGKHTKSVFSDAAQFHAAMRTEGVRGFVVARAGEFRAGLTQVSLHDLKLCSVEEELPSISFISVPCDKVLVAFALDDRTRQVWGGCRVPTSNLVLVGPGQNIHRRSEGAGHWGMIWLPVEEIQDYTRSYFDEAVTIRSIELRCPPASLSKQLRRLHKAIMGASHTRCASLLRPRAAHGLEQQIIQVLMEVLSSGPPKQCAATESRRQELMALFELLPDATHDECPTMARLSAALDIPEEMLRKWCEGTLGMDPARYLRRRRGLT